MELTSKQQALRIIEDSRKILLLTHNSPDGDALGCILATKKVLESLGKEVTAVAPGIIESSLLFLPGSDEVQNQISTKKESKLIIRELDGPIESIAWKRVEEGKVEILISGTKLSPDEIAVESAKFDYDAIIILDSATPELLDNLWEENADLFFEVPTISIDHHPSNTQFAKVNLVDPTAAATAEILVSVFEALGKGSNIITQDVATCLLTGILADTGSFMHPSTTPKALTVAAQLVAAGANQPQIVRSLFQTNSLPTLRIWGRALSYIKEDRENRFIWSTLSRADYVASGADDTNSNTGGVINNLLKSADNVDFVMLLKEKPESVDVSLRSVSQTVNVSEIAQLFGGGGHVQASGFQIKDKKLADVEMEIINKIREYCRAKLTATEHFNR